MQLVTTLSNYFSQNYVIHTLALYFVSLVGRLAGVQCQRKDTSLQWKLHYKSISLHCNFDSVAGRNHQISRHFARYCIGHAWLNKMSTVSVEINLSRAATYLKLCQCVLVCRIARDCTTLTTVAQYV